jgi:dTDP-4-amino-4,6-dideoxygalactose transaminase
VIEDAACALGSELLRDGVWERVGRPRGLVACFSLHPRKVVTTGDGGVLTTRDEGLARRFRLMRQHAMSVPDTVRHASDTVVFEEYLEPAWNYRLTDLQAAVGRPQIARLSAIVAERRRLAAVYHDALGRNRVLAPPRERSNARSNWQSYPARLRPAAGIGQRAVLQFLLDRGIAGKRGVSNAHQEPAYRDHPSSWACGPSPCADGSSCSRLRISERLRDETILLPLFHGMSAEEQGQVLHALEELESASPEKR